MEYWKTNSKREINVYIKKKKGFPGSPAGKESAWNAGDLGSIPGLGRFPGEGKGYPLQYSGLENSRGSIVHGVAKSRTWLSNFQFHLHGDPGKRLYLLRAQWHGLWW